MVKTALNGVFDELRVYSTPLSAAHVASLHQDPTSVDRDDQFMTVYLPFSDSRALTYDYGKPNNPLTVGLGLSAVNNANKICGERAGGFCSVRGAEALADSAPAEAVCVSALANPIPYSEGSLVRLNMSFYSSTSTTDTYVYFLESGSTDQHCASQRNVRQSSC